MVIIRRPNSTQSRTLEAIRGAGEISVKGLQEALGLSGGKGYARISHAVRDLMRAGYIRRTVPATYRYLGEPKGLDYSQAQRRMSRVIRIRTKRREPLTVRKLAELSECSMDWAKRYATFLVKHKYLKNQGYTEVGPTRVKAPAYLAVEEKLNEDWPAMKRCKKTTELDKAVVQIREMAFRVARECEAKPESLQWSSGYLQGMVDIIEEALRKRKDG